MSNITSIDQARIRREKLASREYYNASAFNSPVPLLIEMLEPILETVREKPGADVHEHLIEYLDVLELSRREIDQLEDMASFLMEVNRLSDSQ
jgi:hypothetical protein